MTAGTPNVLTPLRDALAERYRVDRELGSGGMATVYLAHDLRHDRHVDRSGKLDTLFSDATFSRVSPDGRWLAYSNWDLTRIWLEPFPRTGKRWEVVSGNNEEPHWLSPTEFFYTAYDPSMGFDRVRLDPNAANPIVERRRWIDAPGMVATAGPSSTPTPDGRVVYVQGAPDVPVRYLRVIPNWVARMKRAVDEVGQ